jgi:hypothetical protein
MARRRYISLLGPIVSPLGYVCSVRPHFIMSCDAGRIFPVAGRHDDQSRRPRETLSIMAAVKLCCLPVGVQVYRVVQHSSDS